MEIAALGRDVFIGNVPVAIIGRLTPQGAVRVPYQAGHRCKKLFKIARDKSIF